MIINYDEIMAGVKETKSYPAIMRGVDGHLYRNEAEWLNRIPKVLGKGLYVELGTYCGRSACCIAEHLLPGSRFISVDKVQRDWNVLANKNLIGSLIQSDTLFAAKADWMAIVTFLFIDADHSYEAVKADFNAWQGKLKPKGVIAFHDSNLEGVSQLLSEIVGWKEIDRVETLSVWMRSLSS